MSFSSLFSSLVGTLHADAPEEAKAPEPEPQQEEVAAEEAEEEEPEDVRLPVPSFEDLLSLSQVFWAC